MIDLQFTKMNGAGNDFVMLDNRSGNLNLGRDQLARLCDRHRGVGADGVLLVEKTQNAEADFRMRYYNADGGEAEMCGNGARCFARYAARLAGMDSRIRFETQAGVIGADLQGDLVTLAMSAPHSGQPGTPLNVNDQSLVVAFLNTGVPHAVVFVPDVEKVAVDRDGAAIRYHAHFQPKGTNANFVQELAPGNLRVRTYERGVEGETLACGTGVVASALLHHLQTQAPSPISVQVRGGDTMLVGFEKNADGSFSDVTLTGPADFVFEGTISI